MSSSDKARRPRTGSTRGSKYLPNLDKAERLTRKKGNKEDPAIEKKIYMMAKIGGTNLEIAEYFGISHDTLKRRFEDLLTKARAFGKHRLRRLQWTAAENGNPALLIWLGKQVLDQREPDLMVNWGSLSEDQLRDIASGKIPKNLSNKK